MNKKAWYIIIGILLILVLAISFIIFLLRGEEKKTGTNSSIVKSKVLSCENTELDYRFFEKNPDRRKTVVSVIYDDDEFRSISLRYYMYFGNEDEVKKGESVNRYSISSEFGHNGLDANAFSLNFSIQEKQLIYSIYADGASFKKGVGKYFLADDLSNRSSYDDFMVNYKNKNFKCVNSE